MKLCRSTFPFRSLGDNLFERDITLCGGDSNYDDLVMGSSFTLPRHLKCEP